MVKIFNKNNVNLQQWNKEMNLVADYYRNKIKKFGIISKSLGEREKLEDDSFFNALFEGLEINHKLTVLDIGCGTGNLIGYLKNNNLKISDYLGIDLISEFISYCQSKYPQHRFLKTNFIDDEFKPLNKYDLVIAKGILVSKVSNYLEYLEYFISKAIEFANKYFVFNLITEIDKNSANYEHKNEIGGITCLSNADLIKILEKFKIKRNIRYRIKNKQLYHDATDSFVQISLKLE